jgi:hypothetical protein
MNESANQKINKSANQQIDKSANRQISNHPRYAMVSTGDQRGRTNAIISEQPPGFAYLHIC